ncbi:class I SAM-dependent methyltransferase [Rubrobacter indicoceani]|uniref:class I SAM-dependent methyltransferase n=1 Tax=Rubrobacter indicoceani TaxID=2051957 RepID=UPI000E5A7907|nr:class I SAM-dependent methyltransferase [Rubrobacter indicoceani]
MNRDDPLSPQERDEYERDLIRFCDRELDLLGDIAGKSVLYAGGTSPLWIEGLAERIGPEGSLSVLDADGDGLSAAQESFAPDDLPLTPEYVAGDVFNLPFPVARFDLAYSSGLLHELDVAEGEIAEALRSLESVVRAGGFVAASDFVSDVPAVQVEEEGIFAEAARLATGSKLFGVGGSDRIEGLLRGPFGRHGLRVCPPFPVRHLDRLFLAQPEPDGFDLLKADDAARLRARWEGLKLRVKAEGYTRPATVFAVVFPDHPTELAGAPPGSGNHL